MKKCTTCDCSYNITNQLTRLNKLLYNIDTYIKDAKKAKHKDCQKAFENLKKDTEKHAKALKAILIKKAKSNKL